jgi:hypothetical protein
VGVDAAGHWAEPNVDQLAEIERRLGDGNATRIQESPWEAVLNLLLPPTSNFRLLTSAPQSLQPSQSPPPKLYAATRRFDLATIFVAMAGYSLFFGLMALLEVEPFWKLYFGALIAIVGLGQAMLERVIDPRRASIYVGAAAHTVLSLLIWRFAPKLFLFDSFFFVAIINGFIGGAAMGYMAGALVGGVFLIADALRGKFSRTPDAAAANDASTPSPHPLDSIAPPTAGS